MIAYLTLAAAAAVWWSAACRIGKMDLQHHRVGPMLWLWGMSATCLVAAAVGLLQGGDTTALGVALSGALYMLATWPEWASGPPSYTRRDQR